MKNRSERGQTTVMLTLILGLFLLGAVALSVDFTNGYFHGQNAQGAADAACTAGIMDLMANDLGNSLGNFPTNPPSPPNTFLCSKASAAAPCQYAALNGYSAPGLTPNTPSNDVQISFPGSISGSPPPPPALAPYPFLQVDVTDRIGVGFAGLISGKRTVDVGGHAVCALQQAHAPVPIIVLNPSCNQAFDVSGSASVTIVGGPTRSVQVNSNNQTCAAATTSGNGCTSNGHINLTQAGPNFNGANFGLFGAPTAAPPNFNGGSAGAWTPGAAPIGDPFALVNAPSKPSAAPPPQSVAYDPSGTVTGCPDHAGCIEYFPGLYTAGISVINQTAIFAPGIYYITGTNKGTCPKASACFSSCTGQARYGFLVDTQGVVRPAYDSVGGTGYSSGAVFYLSGASGAGSYGSSFFGANAGKAGSRTIDNFQVSNMTCPGASAPPGQLNLPTSVPGNVLLGQCTGSGTWVGATTTTGQTDTTGTVRGLIFFQDRANADTNGQAHMDGGGGLVISGNLYYHNCNSSGTGTGCSSPTTGYNGELEMIGTSGSGTLVLGNITADSFVLNGNGAVAMSLNPNAVYNILKAALIQ